MHSSVTLLQLLSPRCRRLIVFRNERSHPGTRQPSSFICTLDAQIPRCINHISEEALWSILPIDADLNDPRSILQYGLDIAHETATSSLTRLSTSSQWVSRRLCKSSLSAYKNSRAISHQQQVCEKAMTFMSCSTQRQCSTGIPTSLFSMQHAAAESICQNDNAKCHSMPELLKLFLPPEGYSNRNENRPVQRPARKVVQWSQINQNVFHWM